MTRVPSERPASDRPRGGQTPLPVVLAAWLVVVLPAAWGIWQTARQSAALFSASSDHATQHAPPSQPAPAHARP